jgi:hypothetical protein
MLLGRTNQEKNVAFLFIVFHECSHIVNNHSVPTIPINLPELYAKLVNLIDKNPLPLIMLEGIKALCIK